MPTWMSQAVLVVSVAFVLYQLTRWLRRGTLSASRRAQLLVASGLAFLAAGSLLAPERYGDANVLLYVSAGLLFLGGAGVIAWEKIGGPAKTRSTRHAWE